MQRLTDDEIRELLKNGVDFQERLFDSYKEGDLNAIKSLIEAGAAISSKSREYGGILLIWACQDSNWAAVNALIEAGANVNGSVVYQTFHQLFVYYTKEGGQR